MVSMLRIIVSLLLVLLACECGASVAGSENSLVILYLGNVDGYVDSCGCKKEQGGLARRASLMTDLRKNNENILAVDCGDSFSKMKNVPELRAAVTIQGMNLMHYDGLNIAEGEASMGLEFLQGLRAKAQFPFLSANVFFKETQKPLGQEFVIRKFDDGLKVGLIGLASSDFFTNLPEEVTDALEIKDPEATLQKVLPKVRSKVHVVVLLSHLGDQKTRELVQRVPGVDVAVVGHDIGVVDQAPQIGKTILVRSNLRGQFLGVLSLSLDRKRSISGFENKVTPLTHATVPPEPEAQELLADFAAKKATLEADQMQEIQKRARETQIKEQLKLTPEEFMEKMRQDNKLLTPETAPEAPKTQ
jgi:5'-nucleotidase / UDP-sugar diphosphatase